MKKLIPILLALLLIPTIAFAQPSIPPGLEDKIKDIRGEVRTAPYKLDLMGTEYTAGQDGKLWLQLLKNHQAVENATCYLDVYYPDNSLWMNDILMTPAVGNNGIHYYDLTVPETTGVYMSSATCHIPEEAFVDDFLNYSKIETHENTTIRDNKITLFPTECPDGNYTLVDESATLNGSYHFCNFTLINSVLNVGERLEIEAISVHIDDTSEINADYGGFAGGNSVTTGNGQSGEGMGAGGGGTIATYGGSGGGGAGYGGSGGRGGDSADGGTGGSGGSIYGDSSTFDIQLGSGGGSGATSYYNNPSGAGGKGGGVIVLKAYSITAEGKITANGENGGSGSGGSFSSGGGGGGSGGGILVYGKNVDISGVLQAKGGNGGDTVTSSGYSGGPGGGGAGGRIKVFGEDLSLAGDFIVSGGSHGTGGNVDGAENGQLGTFYNGFMEYTLLPTFGWVRSSPLLLNGTSWSEFQAIYDLKEGDITFKVLDQSNNIICTGLGSISDCAGTISPIKLYAELTRPFPENASPEIDRWSVTWEGDVKEELRGSGEMHVSRPTIRNVSTEEIAQDVWKRFYWFGTPPHMKSTQYYCKDNRTMIISKDIEYCEGGDCETLTLNHTKVCQYGCIEPEPGVAKCAKSPFTKNLVVLGVIVSIIIVIYVFTRWWM